MRPFLLLPVLAALAGGCASVESKRLVPIMGMAEGEEERAPGPAAVPPARAAADTATADSAGALAQRILFLPFRDLAEWKGVWDIPVEFARAVSDSLRRSRFARPIPPDGVWAELGKKEREGDVALERGLELGQKAGADYVAFGEIQELAMKRFRAGVPVAGYRSYESLVAVRVQLLNLTDGEPAGDVTVRRNEDTKRYGITNPASYVPFEKEYYLLGQMEWGGEEFRGSLTGAAVQSCIGGLAAAVDSLLRPPELQVSEPKIADVVDGTRAYINVGSADGVQNGRKYGVWDKGRVITDPETGTVLGQSLPRRVGVVQVEQVLTEHLSLVRILEGNDQVVLGYGIRAE
ncbi:MAG: hypothetical protein AB1505_16810 [Candidatus Latescibacterota bacterium]